MSVLELRVFPDPILLQRANKVSQFDAKLRKLAADMVETMSAANGIGLAANQVGARQHLAVIKLPTWEEPVILVNPEVIRLEGNREVEEACLSLPRYYGIVNRATRVRVRFQNLTGQLVKMKADCTLAQAIEHETDHLKGILYIQQQIAPDELFHIKENNEREYVTRSQIHQMLEQRLQTDFLRAQ